MKKLLSIFAALLFSASAFAAGPGGGPGPTPNPWVFNGSQIYYATGCVTVSVTVPGTCNGVGSFTTDNIFVTGHTTFEGVTSTGATGTGNIVYSASPTFSGTVSGTAILPLAGLKTIATNTLLGNITSGTAAVVAQAMPSCSTSTSALTWTTNTGFGCNTSLVTTLSFGTTGLTPNSATSGAITVAGTLIAANGGTGLTSYTIGDTVYASGATTLSKLADVATGNAIISGGVGVAPSYGKIGLTTHVSGVLPVANGGTNLSSYTTGDIINATGSTTLTSIADIATGNALITGGVGVSPSYGKIGLTTHVSGVLPVANGGTALASYTTGDLINATGSTTLASLADIATGNALISGGIGVAPSYGKIGLTTHVSGTLGVGNGGSGAATFTIHGILLGNTASAFGVTAVGTTGQYLKGSTGADPVWGTLASDTVSTIAFGTTGLTPSAATAGAVTVAGTLVPANGGTGFSSYTIGDINYASASTTLSHLSDVATGNAIISGGVGVAPSYGKIGLTTHVSGTLPVANGGTNITSYTTGDIINATGSTTLTAIADIATGNALISGGVGVSPTYGKIGLTTHVSGTLAVGNGGSGAATFTQHGVLIGNSTSAFGVTGVGTTGQVLRGQTGADPIYGQAVLTTDVTGTLPVGNGGSGAATFTQHGVIIGNSTSALAVTGVGTTGQVLRGQTGADPIYGQAVLTTDVTGTLPVANGGSGAATLTGVLKGTGTTAFVAATAGSDFVAPGTATNFTAKQTFTGTSSNLASALVNAAEPATIAATAATGTINYDVCTQSVLYFTSNAAANWTLNLRCSSGTSLNTAMNTGDVVTVVHMVTQGGTAFYNNVVTIDGGANTPKCQSGSCPAAGHINSIDVYTYAIVKTGSATFTVLESQTQFQ